MRTGLLTASEMKLIITEKTLAAASNEKERAHLWELLAQRITGYVEPRYLSDDMMRGHDDEIEARNLYAANFAPGPVHQVGFVTNNRWGFTLGYSPDGLVGDDGALECKSRRQKLQIETIVEFVSQGTIPGEFMIQAQTGLLVSERQWIDFASYSGGLPMAVVRVHPDERFRTAILEAASGFEKRLAEKLEIYRGTLASEARLIPTERRVEQEMYL